MLPDTKHGAPGSQLTTKGFGKNGGHEGVEFGGGFGLEFLKGVNSALETMKTSNNVPLAADFW